MMHASSNDTAAQSYSVVAKAFHWLLALVLTVSFCVGLYMTNLPFGPQRLKFFNWHKWAGVVILALSVLRLLWRLTHRPPAPLPGPAWQRAAAGVTHWGMYMLFLLVPLAGWAYSSSAGYPVVLFGVLPLPDFVPVNKHLSQMLRQTHDTLAFVLAAFVLLHVTAGLKHHFIDRDATLRRMWK